jgi:hypothetical protein
VEAEGWPPGQIKCVVNTNTTFLFVQGRKIKKPPPTIFTTPKAVYDEGTGSPSHIGHYGRTVNSPFLFLHKFDLIICTK